MSDFEHGRLSAKVERPIYVKMPAAALYDFDRFVEVQKSILDILGCPCHSGWDIRYVWQDEYVVGPDLQVNVPGISIR